MSPKLRRETLSDGSFIEVSLDVIKIDQWRLHGFKYRVAWIQNDECRILFDNHHGKPDHFHVDECEFTYHFESIEQLFIDFLNEIKKLGGVL